MTDKLKPPFPMHKAGNTIIVALYDSAGVNVTGHARIPDTGTDKSDILQVGPLFYVHDAAHKCYNAATCRYVELDDTFFKAAATDKADEPAK